MFQNDYIMRLIQQFTVFLARIMGLKASGEIDKAHEVMNEALEHFTGLSEGALIKLSSTQMIRLIGGIDAINVKKCYMLAELLKVKGELYAGSGNVEKSYELYNKSFHIYSETILASSGSIFQPDHGQINELIRALRQFNLPYETLISIFQYYENIGKYGKAEDILFELIEQESYRSETIDEGFAFYERLLQKKPEELEKGSLPLEEVREGLEVLVRLKHKLN